MQPRRRHRRNSILARAGEGERHKVVGLLVAKRLDCADSSALLASDLGRIRPEAKAALKRT